MPCKLTAHSADVDPVIVALARVLSQRIVGHGTWHARPYHRVVAGTGCNTPRKQKLPEASTCTGSVVTLLSRREVKKHFANVGGPP